MEVFGGRVRGVLHGEFKVAGAVFPGDGGGGGRGYGEAACFGDGGDECVEPLAGEELCFCQMLRMGFLLDGSGWTTDFDGVVRVGRRETQDTCCGVYFADVSYGDWFDLVLARFGCCTVLVGNGVMDYCCHGSFNGSLREKMWKWKESRGDSVEGLCEHDPGLYESISILDVTCWSLIFRSNRWSISKCDMRIYASTHARLHVSIGFMR